MDLTPHIKKIRQRIKETKNRKRNHDSFVDNLVHSAGMRIGVLATGIAISGSIDAKAAQALFQDENIDKVENITESTSLSCPVFYEVNEISFSKCKTNQEVYEFMVKKNKACYMPDYNHIICTTFSMSDEEAFNIAKYNRDDLIDVDFNYALSGFRSVLEKNKYRGKMPKTVDDVRQILEGGLSGLKEKQQEKIKQGADDWGLLGAVNLIKKVEKENEINTSEKVVNHEYIHAKNADIKKKALLPDYLISPAHLFLLNAADELEAQLNGKTGKDAANDAVLDIINTATTSYTGNWFKNVENNMSIIKEVSLQKLEIDEYGKAVDNFSAKNYEKLLEEMIPDKTTRETVKIGLEKIKKMNLIIDKEYYEASAFSILQSGYYDYLRKISDKDIEFAHSMPYTKESVSRMIANKKNMIISENGAEHYKNLADASQNYKIEKGKVKKINTDNKNISKVMFAKEFDYGK